MSVLDDPIHVRLTNSFIDMNAVALVLTRLTETSDGTGGTVKGAPTEKAPQRCRIVGQGGRNRILSGMGDSESEEVIVVGSPDLDILKGDRFLHLGEKYEVVSINNKPPWAIRARAVLRG